MYTHARPFAAIAAIALFASVPFLTACQQKTLFSEDDVSTRNRLRYFGNESAQQTTESRRQSAQWGFGFPTGPGDQ